MPIKEVVYKSALVGDVTSFIESKRKSKEGGNDGDVEFLSVIDFIEKFKLLPYGLYPVQKFIVKMYYNIPLEDVKKTITVTDKFNEKTLYNFTEAEYLKYLHNQGRCNLSEQDGKDRRELILVIGRRSGKCSDLSTNVLTTSGYVSFLELINTYNPSRTIGWNPINVDVIQWNGRVVKSDAIYYGGKQACKNIKTETGYFQTSTLDHKVRILVNGAVEWRRFEDLSVGDNLAVIKDTSSLDSNRIREWDRIVSITDDVCEVADINVSDGHEYIANGIENHNSALSSIFAAYELYKLLRRGNPQSFYGMPNGSEIRVLCVANDKDQASIVYGDMQSHIESVDYFKSAVANTTQTFMKFRTENDKKKFGEVGKASIAASFKSSIAKGLRGRGVICAILDEIAFFVDDGRCLNVNSRVLTNHGYLKLNTLLDMFDVNRSIVGWTKCHIKIIKESSEESSTVGIYYGGIKLTRLITTKSGYEVDATHEHRLKVMSPDGEIVWKCVKDINDGDYIGINRSTNYWSSDDLNVHKFVELSNLKNRRHKYKSHQKHTPWAIFQSPKSVVSKYLSGLFEKDGGTENEGRTVSFYTVSEALAKETQLLLLNFGITSVICRNKTSAKFVLRIKGSESRKIFADEIGFITNRKNLQLLNGLQKYGDALNIIPFQRKRLQSILDSIPKNPGSWVAGDLRTRCTKLVTSSLSRTHKNYISYTNARKIVELLGPSYSSDLACLDHITKSNYFWDPVVRITEKESEVADLKVPSGEQYVAQGMTNHNSSAEQLYRAITPSLAQFSPRDPKNKLLPIGPSEGRMILISSPDAKEGFFYRIYQSAMSNSRGASDTLLIQAPTWEVNPTLDRSYYEKEYHKNPKAFMTEHGAEFSDRVRGWIEDSRDLTECINPDLRPVAKGYPRELHFAGIDVGLVNDGTCIALTRINNGKIELVYHETWYAKKKWKESNPHLLEPLTPYAYTLQDQLRIDMSEIALWFKAVSQRFYIYKAIFDQWSGIVFEQELHKNGLRQFEVRNFFSSENSQMYQTMKMFMYNRQLSLYDFPAPESTLGIESVRHSPLITELLELQSTSGGKNIVSVEAPKASGKHDDMSDALARSVLLAAEYTKDNPGVLDKKSFGVNPESVPKRTVNYGTYHRIRNQLHGGGGLKTPSRQKPR